ncbi:protein Sey1p [[Candida] jaroonii]|uniref:Protein Sey1p n=1 Tax=[Candida] jaroonii TaxID=467808 RepID=A0ACA9Y786_9ASCO|nr:protein Sey1p [[Candida] jaroonii]
MTDHLDVEELSTSPSNSSSNSSFVPIDKQVVFDAVQVIDESKTFNDRIIQYIEKTSPIGSIGNNYHIVSVFGSQSTGKSTLLNNLFNTNFDVMDENRRQQTTKGIWLAYSPMINSSKPSIKDKKAENIFVMDVEGTDGRERGEDQDFERKSALFAISTSEILIINIWEHQIGLYQGANMGLLKTVFEVNLSLFGKTKLSGNDDHKVLLLFVIRDYVGVTPIENLAATIKQDLKKMWDDLNKPSELSDLKFDQFFDLKFHTLSHKILQLEKFQGDVRLLGDKFVNPDDSEYLWKPNYHHNIPIDGWTMYASNCWEQIDSNKDLDLPTQQILVAKFKCDEILNNLFLEFTAKYNELLLSKAGEDTDYKEIGLLMKDLKDDYLDQFEISASKYNSSVFQSKQKVFQDKILDKYQELFNVHSKRIINTILKQFKDKMAEKSDEKFVDRVDILTKSSKKQLSDNLTMISLDEIKFDTHESDLHNEINEIVAKQQVMELNGIVSKLVKKLSSQLNKLIVFEINDIGETTWDSILSGFKKIIDNLLSAYYDETTKTYNFNLGIDETTTSASIDQFKFKAWVKFYQLIQKNLSKDSILNILKDRFDEKFRYDENGIPKLYNNEMELDKNFNNARLFALKVIPQLCMIKLSDSTEIIPDYDIFDKDLVQKYDENYNFDDEEDEDSNKFSHIISEEQKTDILNKFKKEIDAKYIETKRSIIQHVTSIPYYIYIIIVVLGWNEFLAVIRSPIFFTLVLLFGGVGYAMYQLNLIKPAMVVGQRMLDETIVITKQKLKEFLIDDHDLHQRNFDKMKETENIELDDLSESKD